MVRKSFRAGNVLSSRAGQAAILMLQLVCGLANALDLNVELESGIVVFIIARNHKILPKQ